LEAVHAIRCLCHPYIRPDAQSSASSASCASSASASAYHTLSQTSPRRVPRLQHICLYTTWTPLGSRSVRNAHSFTQLSLQLSRVYRYFPQADRVVWAWSKKPKCRRQAWTSHRLHTSKPVNPGIDTGCAATRNCKPWSCSGTICLSMPTVWGNDCPRATHLIPNPNQDSV